MIETGGERGSGKSVLVVRHDDDDICGGVVFVFVQKVSKLPLYLPMSAFTNNDLNINFIQNSPLNIQHTYSCEFSIG